MHNSFCWHVCRRAAAPLAHVVLRAVALRVAWRGVERAAADAPQDKALDAAAAEVHATFALLAEHGLVASPEDRWAQRGRAPVAMARDIPRAQLGRFGCVRSLDAQPLRDLFPPLSLAVPACAEDRPSVQQGVQERVVFLNRLFARHRPARARVPSQGGVHGPGCGARRAQGGG